MSFTFPPPISAALLIGLIALALGLAAFARPEQLRGNSAGRLLESGRFIVLFVGIVLTLSAFFSGATPETQLANPIPRTVQSIDAGGLVYTSNCAACHGADARGGGPQSGSTAVRPPALAGPSSHLSGHTDGDLHYWIANGLPGGMPAWAGQLSEDDIWNVINYLRSLNGDPPTS